MTDLSIYDNSWYNPGENALKRILWYFANLLFIKSHWMPVSSFKCKVLRMFGAKIGKKVVIKPGVNIKYPWRLEIGDFSWIGEDVWIDNLANVKIGKNCCLSQGALLLCGNHNFKKSTFDLMIGEITIEDGAWVGAKAVICPGVTLKSHCVVAVGSVMSSEGEPFTIYRGIPACPIKKRVFE